MGRKTRKIGKGLWNGYGGKIELGETPVESAIRETLKESGGVICQAVDLAEVAIMDFINTDETGQELPCRAHVFFAYRWEGEPKDSDEVVDPTWFDDNRLPLDEMLPADKVWLPEILGGRKIYGLAKYTSNQGGLIGEVEIKEMGACPK